MPVTRNDTPAGDLLTKGVICALIGAVILLAPWVARSEGVRDIMRQMYLVGWFALVLGLAFMARYAFARLGRRGHDQGRR
ncbi:MAG: hypothetical protein OZ923_03365 [Comamonadaceae bacterium]|nr:hypothetical protein [Comamonadaceae bacterium]